MNAGSKCPITKCQKLDNPFVRNYLVPNIHLDYNFFNYCITILTNLTQLPYLNPAGP